MDEKTAELRDIFIDTTGEDTVTEGQEESPGSLTKDEEAAVDRVVELVAEMRDRYAFDSSLTDDEYVRVATGHFDGDSDAEIADELGLEPDDVLEARLDLHLVDLEACDAPIDVQELKRLRTAGTDVDACVSQLVDGDNGDADPQTVRELVAIVDANLESTRANDRFRDELRALLTDADLEGRLAADAHEDGLREAAEDIETDVSF